MKVKREMQSRKYIYKISNSDCCFGESNYTYGFIPRRITVFSNNKNVLELKQTNWLLKIINSLPVLNTETFTPFHYFENQIYCGNSKKIILNPIFNFKIKEDVFELRQHNNNFISLMQNGMQVALYKREASATLERNEYEIKYSKSMMKNIPLLLLFCIFTDVVYYPNISQISYYKYEKNYVFKDSYKERTTWEPISEDNK